MPTGWTSFSASTAVADVAKTAPGTVGRALVARAELAFEQQEYAVAQRCADAALEEFRMGRGTSFVAGALRVLGSVELRLGHAPRATELADEAIAAARAAGDAWEEGLALGTRAAAAARQGRIREAQRSYDGGARRAA